MPHFDLEVDGITVHMKFYSGDPSFDKTAREIICNQIAADIAMIFGSKDSNSFPINFYITVNGTSFCKADMN